MYKIIVRSIFYHWFALFIGLSLGFIANSEWVGERYVLIERSISNIFYPIQYDSNVEEWIKHTGRMKLWSSLDCPQYFEIIEEVVKGEEFYWAIYKTKDSKGKEIKDIGSVRVRWKTWEYYYKIDEPVVE